MTPVHAPRSVSANSDEVAAAVGPSSGVPEVASQRRAAGDRSASAAGSRVLGLLGVLAFLTIWELVSRAGLLDERYLPRATVVLGELIEMAGTSSFWTAVRETMVSWALGLSIASGVAVAVGFAIGSSRFLRRLTHSTIEFLRPIPSVSLVPLAVLLFGVDIRATLVLVAYACFWQVLIQVLYGVTDADTVAINTARCYGLGRAAVLWHVILPSTLPYLLTGLRLAASAALILTVTAGLVIGTPGLGRRLTLAQSAGSAETIYAIAVATGLIGVLVNVLMRQVERRGMRWHPSIRAEVAG